MLGSAVSALKWSFAFKNFPCKRPPDTFILCCYSNLGMTSVMGQNIGFGRKSIWSELNFVESHKQLYWTTKKAVCALSST